METFFCSPCISKNVETNGTLEFGFEDAASGLDNSGILGVYRMRNAVVFVGIQGPQPTIWIHVTEAGNTFWLLERSTQNLKSTVCRRKDVVSDVTASSGAIG